MKIRLDNNDFAFIPAVTLSYLKTEEQELLNECMEQNNLTIDTKKADMLRKCSKESKLNSESIYQILSGKLMPKPKHLPILRLSNDVYSKYFKPEQSSEEIQGVVEKALDLYFVHHKEGVGEAPSHN